MNRVLILALATGLALAPIATASAQRLPTAPASSRAVDEHDALWPAAPPAEAIAHPILRRGHDIGLISAGIGFMSLGMAIGAAMASFDVAQGNCSEFSTSGFFSSHRVQCGTAPFALVPFAGPVLVGSVAFHGSPDAGAIIAGSLALAPQILGLVLLLMGVHGYTEDLVSADDLHVRIEPIVSSTQLGLELRLSL